jgi:hypothetical protein
MAGDCPIGIDVYDASGLIVLCVGERGGWAVPAPLITTPSTESPTTLRHPVHSQPTTLWLTVSAEHTVLLALL